MLRIQERNQNKEYKKEVAEANEAARKLDYSKIKKLQEKDRLAATKLYQNSLEELWGCFDENRDGVLSLEENGKLMKLYIEVSVEVTQKRIQENFIQGVMNTIPHGPKKEQILEVAKKVVSKVPDWMKQWTTKHFNTDDFRGRTLRAMDVNRDGKVEKQEFTSKFFEAVQDGIDYSEMSQEMSAHFLPMLQVAAMTKSKLHSSVSINYRKCCRTRYIKF